MSTNTESYVTIASGNEKRYKKVSLQNYVTSLENRLVSQENKIKELEKKVQRLLETVH